MSRAVTAIANLFRVAFWPLAASVLVVLLLQPCYFFSLTLLQHIVSRERTAQHLTAAFEQGVLSDDGSPRPLLWKGGEQVAECISLGIGLNPAETDWQAAVVASYPAYGAHPCEGLHRAVLGAATLWQPYFRYWHGYRVVLSPLAALFPLWFVKIINVLLIAAACALFWRTLRRRCGDAAAAVFLITFVCLSDVLFLWRTSTHSISLAYILMGASLFATALRRDWTPASLVVLAAVLGSGFNFIDFLINPPMMPMLIAFFILLGRRRDCGIVALSVIAGWFLGYAETWIAKWALAYLTMPGPGGVISDVLSNIEIRTIGAFNGVYLVPMAATLRTFLRSLNRFGVVVPLAIVLAIAHYSVTVSRIDWRRALWLSCPILVSVAWFEALSSHTQFHLTVSARSAAAAFAILVTALVVAMERRPSIPELWAQLGILRTKLPLLGRPR